MALVSLLNAIKTRFAAMASGVRARRDKSAFEADPKVLEEGAYLRSQLAGVDDPEPEGEDGEDRRSPTRRKSRPRRV